MLSGVRTIDDGLARFRILAERARKHHMMLAWGLYAYLAHTMPKSTTESLRQLQAALNAPTFKWTDELSKAFVITKALGTRWVLTAPLDYGRPVIIQTDSSKVANLMGRVFRSMVKMVMVKYG